MYEIEEWLKKYDLSEYSQVFKTNKIDFVVLRSLTESDLERFGIHKLSDRLRIMRLIKKEKALKAIQFGFAVLSPSLAIVLFFMPFFDFSTLENAVFKQVSGIDMVSNIGAVLKGGIENSIEKMYLFSMLILPISIVEIIFILSLSQDDLLYKRGCGLISVQLSIIFINLYFIAISLGYNKDGIGFYEYGRTGYYVYLFLCLMELIIAVLTPYNSGDKIPEKPKVEPETTVETEVILPAQPDKSLLKQLMAQNRAPDVFDALTQYYASIQKNEPGDFLLLKGQYQESRRMKNLGIIDHLENKEENRIKLAVLEFIEKM